MKLVTFTQGGQTRPGILEGDQIEALRIPTMRDLFELGPDVTANANGLRTGERFDRSSVKLRAPIIPKKFFHTAGNFREHAEEGKKAGWVSPIRPWIVFFQNVDAIIGPDEPVIYPEHLTEELDYEMELAVVQLYLRVP